MDDEPGGFGATFNRAGSGGHADTADQALAADDADWLEKFFADDRLFIAG